MNIENSSKKDRYIDNIDYYIEGNCLFLNEYSLDDRTTRIVTELVKDRDLNQDRLKKVYKAWLAYKRKLQEF